MNSSRKGNSAECFVAAEREEQGWVVASRRHIGGAGDLLLVHPVSGEVWLVEVKDRKKPYDGFRRTDRQAMRDTALPPGSSRYLANVRGSKENRTIEWTHERDWPS